MVLTLLALSWGAGAAPAEEGDIHLLAQLVWATDGPKPADKELKEADVIVRARLRGVFRWKNYYEVGRKQLKLGSPGFSRVRLSPKCEIEVEHFGKANFEVRLFGEGKMVVKKRQSLTPGELLVLAGDDKDDTAWFVVIRLEKP